MPIEVFTRVKDGTVPIFSKNKNSCQISFTNSKKKYDFTVNDVWDSKVTNNNIFSKFNKNSNFYNDVYFITFGYTGTGKTFTTFGVLEEFLNYHMHKKNEMYISAFQIYNEKVYDLLQRNKELQVWKTDELKIKNLMKKKNYQHKKNYSDYSKIPLFS